MEEPGGAAVHVVSKESDTTVRLNNQTLYNPYITFLTNREQDTVSQRLPVRRLSCSEDQAPLVVQMVKNLPAIQETWVRSLGWEDPLEKGMATHSNILA